MRILLHFLFLGFDCVENIIFPQRRRRTEKENIWSAKEKRTWKIFGEEKYLVHGEKEKRKRKRRKKFPEKENAMMCDKHRDRLCKDRARILESQQ